MTKVTKQQIMTFNAYSNYILGNAAKTSTKADKVFEASVKKMKKAIQSIIDETVDTLQEEAILKASVDEKGNLLIVDKEGYSYTPTNKIALNKAIKEVLSSEVVISSYFSEYPETLPKDVFEAMLDFVIPRPEED